MQRLIAYMKRLGIRPVELLRGFDKNVLFDITKDEFIRRLKASYKLYYKIFGRFKCMLFLSFIIITPKSD
jgi:hypothetical protein